MTKRVLVTATDYSRNCPDAKMQLEAEGFEVVENPFGRPMTFDELAQRVGEVDAVIAGVDTWDETVFSIAPRLRIIARFGVGVDNIDIDAAKRHGVAVTNAPGANANAVAELTLGLILSSMRSIPKLHNAVRRVEWDRTVGHELTGRTVGLLGFGNIARKVARKLSGLDVSLMAYDKFPDEDAARALDVTLKDMDEVISSADVLCMLLPSLPETKGIMDDYRFAQMKEGAIFVNTARGALVQETALKQVLDNGHLGGAAIDVYEVEPASADNPLFSTERIITTPHTAAETWETFEAVGAVTAQAIVDLFSGSEPVNRL
ncbi:phosphoglycerate dehydrogenase [Aidingimonas lacisalsi]|uniref:phosphoglycerate dehydrogenase n=1 Tax=Aidingimonas lacisalsi TaxID=2604086 RepID=UPI0011D27AD5|nr:phosphoglycerate dehydrogenase [Aidingimonas lacisalsi]